MFVKSWECGKHVCTCLVDLIGQACDRLPCEMLWDLQSFSRFWVKSLHSCSDVCIHVGRVKSQPLTVGVGLRQGFVLSPLVFIVNVHWTDSYSRVDEGVTVGSCKINRLIFADDLVLPASFQQGLHHTLHQFFAACDRAGMKISTKNTGVWYLSRHPRQYMLQVSGNTRR